MRTADVRVTEMNARETKTFTFDFSSPPDLLYKIDTAIYEAKWEKEGNQNFEILVIDEEQFLDDEMDMLEDAGVIFGY